MPVGYVPGLTDQTTRVVNTFTISTEVSTLCANYQGYANTDWIYECVTLLQGDGYDCQPVDCGIKTYNPDEPIIPVYEPDDFLQAFDPIYESTPWMLVYDPEERCNYTGFNRGYAGSNPTPYYWDGGMNYRAIGWNEGASSYTLYGNAYKNLINVYPILSSESWEHYIGYVRVTARNKAGGTIDNQYLYVYEQNYANSYPYIIKAEIQYKYKADLTGNSTGSEVFLGFLSKPINATLYSDADTSRMSAGRSHQGKFMRCMGRTMLLAPSLTTGVYNPPVGSPYWSMALSSTDGIGFSHLHLYIPDSVYVENERPFLYFTLQDVYEAANSRGFAWTTANNGIREWHGENTTSDQIHVPIIGENGVTTTSDYSGAQITPNWNKPENFNPNSPIVGQTYPPNSITPDRTIDLPPLNTPNISNLGIAAPTNNAIGCFGTYYALTAGQVLTLNDSMWTQNDNWWADLCDSLKFWGSSPIDSVMGFKLYPFDVGGAAGATVQVPIKFGRTVLPGTTGYLIPQNSSIILDLGETWINANNLGLPHDFRMFSPYTEVNLYIPFIGTHNIDISHFVDSKLSIKMIVDISTGSCTAVLLKDDIAYKYYPGSMGIDIPMTQNSMISTANAVLQTTMELVGNFAGETVSFGSGMLGTMPFKNASSERNYTSKNDAIEETESMIGSLESSIDTAVSSYVSNIGSAILTNKGDLETKGASSPGTSMYNPLHCYLFILQQEAVIPINYGHVMGYVCNFTDYLKNVHGFTVCCNPDLTGIKCTKLEQNMIMKLLESGVYL